MDSKTADALIARVAKGDMSALEALYDQFSGAVFAYAMTIVKNRDIAEDVMQDVFVRIYKSAPGFRSEGLGKAWIMRIARNLSLNAVTRGRGSYESDEELENMRAPDRPEESAITRVDINNALGTLSDDERQIVTLHAVSDMTLGDIAKTMGLPLGTVKWKHAAALKKLRGAVSEM